MARKLLLIILLLVLMFCFSIIIYQHNQLKSNNLQFKNIRICLEDSETTKELIGATIIEEGKLECIWIYEGLAYRKTLEGEYDS